MLHLFSDDQPLSLSANWADTSVARCLQPVTKNTISVAIAKPTWMHCMMEMHSIQTNLTQPKHALILGKVDRWVCAK